MKEINKVRVGIWKVPLIRIILLVISDLFAILLAAVLPLYVRYDFRFLEIPQEYWYTAIGAYFPNVLLTLIIFRIFHLYNSVWRYASDTELINNLIAVVLCTLMQPVLFWLEGIRMPISYPLFYGFFLLVFTCGSRFGYRILRAIQNVRRNNAATERLINCMIVGGGAAGNAIIKELDASRYLQKRAVCVIDDNPGCHGKYLRGVPIVGGREEIPRLVREYDVAEIILAIPSANQENKKALLEICKETGCRIKILPGMYQLINGDVSVSQLREVQIEDLLGREPISVNVEEIVSYVQNQTILVTGAGGSIGSELCRQIAEHHPKHLILLDIYENGVYEVQQELVGGHPALELTVLIASVRNALRIEEIFEKYRPDIVYHAAAHKHVPLMENSPNEAIKNNVFGTRKVARAADKYGTKRFVLISTDKAVNPTNIMGASKRICEMMIQMMNKRSATEYVAVRFGNVLGSNGSVVPLFRRQIAQGGPVTVTHPDIIRYFMTIPEAVTLVLQAGAYARGGEIFVLDMGEPMRVLDLAKNMIKLSGYRVGEDIQIEFTGLRPGEKMYEELLLKEEGLKETANRLIYIGRPIEFDAAQFVEQLEHLEKASEEEADNIRELVKGMVPTYCYER